MRTKAEKRERKRRRKTPVGDARAVKRSSKRIAAPLRPLPAPGWVDPALPWYVVRAATRREATAEKELHDLDFRVWLPRVSVTLEARGKVSEVERALFPGYLLVQVNDDERAEHFHVVAEAETMLRLGLGMVGVSDGMGSVRPTLLPRRFMAGLLARIEDGARAAMVVPEPVLPAPGDQVQILAGPFAGFLAVVDSILPGFKAQISLDIFGRSTDAEIGVDLIERV